MSSSRLASDSCTATFPKRRTDAASIQTLAGAWEWVAGRRYARLPMSFCTQALSYRSATLWRCVRCPPPSVSGGGGLTKAGPCRKSSGSLAVSLCLRSPFQMSLTPTPLHSDRRKPMSEGFG